MTIENERFSKIEYSSYNFLKVSNAAFVNIVIYITLVIVVKIMNKMTVKCYKFKIIRKLGVILYSINVWNALIRLYFLS